MKIGCTGIVLIEDVKVFSEKLYFRIQGMVIFNKG